MYSGIMVKARVMILKYRLVSHLVFFFVLEINPHFHHTKFLTIYKETYLGRFPWHICRMEATHVEKVKPASHEVHGPSMDEWDPWHPPCPPLRPMPPGLDLQAKVKLINEVQ